MYELNPCNVCMNLYKNTGPNVNDINNCVYEITRAFNRAPNIDSFVKIDTTKCDRCIEQVLKNMGPFPGGLTCCDLKVNPPPVYNQIPHYVPELITQNLSVDEAKDKCIKMCKLNTKYVNQCIDFCKIDAAALSKIETQQTKQNSSTLETLEEKNNSTLDNVSLSKKIFVIILILLILLSIILSLYKYILNPLLLFGIKQIKTK